MITEVNFPARKKRNQVNQVSEKVGESNLDKYSKVNSSDRKNIVRAIGFLSQIGFTVFACVLVGVLLGRFLDGRLGTDPWLTIVFSILGCLSAFKAMIDVAKKF